jgi:dihydroxy-acid dehydratase
MPGALMAMGRLNRPSLMVYGGTVAPGQYKGKPLTLVSAFEALGQKLSGALSEEDFEGIVRNACPGAGACGGMYTANTMAAAIEALGMSLPYSSSAPALSPQKQAECDRAGKAIRRLLEKDLKPADIMTRAAFENAMVLITVLGGSTNAVIHLIAIASSVGVPLSPDDFQRVSDRVPVLADFKPSGRYLMQDLHHHGGIPAVLKYLLQKGMLQGDCLTVTGTTLAENLREVPGLDFGAQQIVYPVEQPLKAKGHLQVLYGNIAPEGCIAKITGKEGEYFEGPARVFDAEKELVDGILNGRVKAGDVVVIRYVGPKGGPGMPEMLKPTSAIMGAGLGSRVALVTDGRFSGGSHGFVVGHITPEAFAGGPLALVQENDRIEIDAAANAITLKVTGAELAARQALWKQPELPVSRGVLFKYAQTVTTARQGCVTDTAVPVS